MKFRITKYIRAGGIVFYTVEKKGWISWKGLDYESRYTDRLTLYATRADSLASIDKEMENIALDEQDRKNNKIVSTSIEYIER